MLRFGLYHIDQLDPARYRAFLGRVPYISIALYGQLQETNHPEKEFWMETIISNIVLPNRTYKKTQSNRFDAFDSMALGHVRTLIDGATPLSVHDMAVSDGRTVPTLYNRLAALYPEVKYLATDLYPYVFCEYDRRNNDIVGVFDPDGILLQVVRPPFVFDMFRDEGRKFPLNALARMLVMRTTAKRLARQFARRTDADSQRLNLLHPDCARLLEQHRGFTLQRHDIFGPAQGTFHVVRGMNILNASYFTPDQFARICANVLASLHEGGLFITGSNQDRDSTVNGGVYQRRKGRFALVESQGAGSPAHAALQAAEIRNQESV